MCLGIPMEEEEEEPDTSIKGRLLSLLYKIKGRPQKTEEEPSEKEQAVPSKPTSLFCDELIFFSTRIFFIDLLLQLNKPSV